MIWVLGFFLWAFSQIVEQLCAALPFLHVFLRLAHHTPSRPLPVMRGGVLPLLASLTCVRALSGTTRVLNVALPPLPSGGTFALLEGLDDRGEDEDAESLADLLSVGGSVWPGAAALCRWLAREHEGSVRGARVLEVRPHAARCTHALLA